MVAENSLVSNLSYLTLLSCPGDHGLIRFIMNMAHGHEQRVRIARFKSTKLSGCYAKSRVSVLDIKMRAVWQAWGDRREGNASEIRIEGLWRAHHLMAHHIMLHVTEEPRESSFRATFTLAAHFTLGHPRLTPFERITTHL